MSRFEDSGSLILIWDGTTCLDPTRGALGFVFLDLYKEIIIRN